MYRALGLGEKSDPDHGERPHSHHTVQVSQRVQAALTGLVLGGLCRVDMSVSPLMLLLCPDPLSTATLRLEVTVRRGQRARKPHLRWPPITALPHVLLRGRENERGGKTEGRRSCNRARGNRKRNPTCSPLPRPMVVLPSVSSGEQFGRDRMQTTAMAQGLPFPKILCHTSSICWMEAAVTCHPPEVTLHSGGCLCPPRWGLATLPPGFLCGPSIVYPSARLGVK